MSKLLVAKKQIPWPKRRYLLGVSTGRAGQVCAKPTIDPLRGSGFAGRFAIEWHRFQVKLKPDRDHWKIAKISEILPDPTKIRWGFCQIQWFFPQIVPRITGFGVSMSDLIVLVVEIYQIKLKTCRKAGEYAKIWCL